MDLRLLEKALISLFCAIVLAITISKLRGKRFKLPPGPFPIPVFGNWLQVGDDLNHRNLTDLARRFGDILLLRMGQRNLVVVSSPDHAKEVLHTQGVEFGSRTRNVVFDIFTGKGQDMVFTVYGEHWRKMRRIMTVPFFTNKVVQQYRFGWEDEAAGVVDDVKKMPEASTTGIVLRRRLQLMMYNNMYRIMFDRRFESENDPLFVSLKTLNGERSRLAQSFDYNYGDFIPILRPFLRGYLKICKEVKDRRLQLFKDHFLEERKKLGSTKATDNAGLKCAIDHILDAQKKGEINEDNVLYIVENINVAAIETTLWSIEWGIAELVNHPEIQQKLRLLKMGILSFLINPSETVLWSTNASKAENPVAQLLDSGNLVIKDDSQENHLWQSFDYPTNTLLPGMKLCWNLRTGLNRFLSSWKSDSDPSTSCSRTSPLR
ncbi:hypothetical protein NE237_004058 [Protea cynaroides]|uniref:trans-cinnamate 4-monooxygenase n=1 Tax=Protea cynaroides TaxID=273540 RepID=A0A9Q0KIP4_9MAGN|nr:hypothetical protein NE237_004058 [Protea cynaroides]